MIYTEYEKMWVVIRKQEKELFDLINKRDELFTKTQPKATTLDKEIVDGNNPSNMMESYVIQEEYYTMRIEQLQQSLDDRYQALKRKREELKLSKNICDRIYYLKNIEKLNVFKVSVLVNYSKEQVYRYLRKMNKNIKMTQNDTNHYL